METLATLREILQLGWPAIVTIMLFVLWRAYDQRVQEHIRDLRYLLSIQHDLNSEGWQHKQHNVLPPARREPPIAAQRTNPRDEIYSQARTTLFGPLGFWTLAGHFWRG